MSRFRLTVRAVADLKEIGRYTQNRWGRDQRNIYLTQLDDCFRQLAANPLTGKDCSDIRAGYRQYPAGSHVIFYRRLDEETIEIVRILHGRMENEENLVDV